MRLQSHLKTNCCQILCALALCMSGAGAGTIAAQADDGPAARTKEVFKAADSKDGSPVAVTLEDVRDTGILLHFLKENILGVYREASRTKIGADGSADLPELATLPAHIKGALLPPRQQWLVFFVGTIEPVIRELGKEVGNGKGALNPVIPADIQKTISPLWQDWSDDVKLLNAHLDELVPLFDDAEHNNDKIQTAAINLFADTNKLDETRKKIFKAMQEIEKNSPNSKILVSPHE